MKWWNNRRVGMKIALSFLFPLVLIVLATVWIYQASLSVSRLSETIRDERLMLAQTAQQMDKDVIQIQQWLTDISATRGQNGLDDGFEKAKNHYNSFLAGLEQFRAVYAKNSDQANLQKTQELQERVAAYYAMGRKMANAYIKESTQAGNRTMAEFDKSAERLSQSLQPFIEKQVAAMESDVKVMTDSIDRLALWMLPVFGLVLLILVLSGALLTRSITAPLSRCVTFVRSLEHGDLAGDISSDSRDEVGQLVEALQSMSQRLRKIVGDVRHSADSVVNAAREIASGNGDLAQRTEEQASNLEETAASMEEMTTTIRENASHTGDASRLADTTRQLAEAGGRVVNRANSAMSEISSSSAKIAEIIGVIDEIAFQTNLLALNAAVEAARAGDQGRGFATVAGEVRSLAQRSATAATEIKKLIHGSLEKIKAGTALVNESGKSLGEVVEAVDKVSGNMSDIAAATQEQSLGIEQVNKAVMQMDEMTRQNAALVEEIAAASLALEEQAQVMTQMVSFFKVPGMSAAVPEPAPVMEPASMPARVVALKKRAIA